MTMVIERLRASKEKYELPAWIEEGREWAMNDADYQEIKRFGRASEEGNFECFKTGYELLNSILLDIDIDIDEFKEDVFDGEMPSLNELRWWLEGVNQVWSDVKDQL